MASSLVKCIEEIAHIGKRSLPIKRMRDQMTNIAEILLRRANETGDQIAFTFLRGENVEQSITYSQLYNRAMAIAHRLLATPDPQDRVILFYPPGLDYI